MEPGPGRHSSPMNLVPLPRSCGSMLIQKSFPAVPGKTLLAPAFLQREECWSHGEQLQERHLLFMEENLGAVRKDFFLWVRVELTEVMWVPCRLPTSHLCFCGMFNAIHQQESSCKESKLAIAHDSRAQAGSAEQEGAVSCSQCQDQLTVPSKVYPHENFPSALLKQTKP